MSSLTYRLLPALCTLGAFLAMALLHFFGSKDVYGAILEHWGILPFRFPFLDLHNSLAAWQCAREGLDVIVSNPCDVLNRGYTYGPIWLAFSFVPFGIDDTGWMGFVLALCFIASLSFLPSTKGRREVSVMILACLSTMVVFAIERANADIIVFMLGVMSGNLATRGPLKRVLAYALIIVSGLFKYYPITMLILAARERTGTFLAVIGAALSIVFLFIGVYHDELQRGLPLIAHGQEYFTDRFGAGDLPDGLVALFPWLASVRLSILGCLLLLALAVCSRLLRKNILGELSLLDERQQTFLLIGCALIVGCFFAGQSIGYRGIALLFTLPGLMTLDRAANRRIAGLAGGAVLFLMWEEAIRVTLFNWLVGTFSAESTITVAIKFAFWVGRELVWWWVVTVMAAILVRFVVTSQATTGLVVRTTGRAA